jgi:hypothetical protein
MSQPDSILTPQPRLLERTASTVVSAVSTALILAGIVTLMAVMS